MAVDIGAIKGTVSLKDDYTSTLTGLEAGIKRTAASMKNAGRMMSMAITAPVVGITTAVTAMAASFESEMLKINTLVGVNRDIVNKWSDDLLAMAPKVGRGPKELAEALFVVTSAGIRSAEALKIVQQAAQASAIGLGQTKTVARAVTAAMQAYSAEGLNATRATEIMVATVREGNLEAASLAGSLGRVIGIASQVGVSFSEVGGFIASFTRLGVSAEESVTALRGVINSMLKPTQESEEALGKLGLSAEKLRQSIGEQGLSRTLFELVGMFKGNEAALATIIPNVRALSGVMGTAAAQGKEYIDVTDNITNSQNILAEAFAVVKTDVVQQFKEIKAEIEVLAITIGKQLLPIVRTSLIPMIKTFLGQVMELVKWFDEASRASKSLAFELVAIGAALGPVLWITGSILGVLPAFAGAITALNISLGSTSAAAALSTANVATLGTTSIIASKKVWTLTFAARALVVALKWIAAAAVAAFVGWKIGEVISSLTGLTKATETYFGTLDKHGMNKILSPEDLKLIEAAEKKLGRVFERTQKGWREAMKAMQEHRMKMPGVKEEYDRLGLGVDDATDEVDELNEMLKRLAEEGLADVGDGIDDIPTNHPLWKGIKDLPGFTPQVLGIDKITSPFEDLLENVIPGLDKEYAETAKTIAAETEEITEQTVDWSRVLEDVAHSFTALGIEANSVLGQIIGSMATALAAGQQMREGLDQGGISGFTKAGMGALQGAGAIMGATGSGSRGARVGKGAAAGGAVGAEVGGPIGAAVGAAIGAIVGALRGRKTLGIMRDAGRDMGVAVTEALADEIAESGKHMSFFVAQMFEEAFAAGDPGATADRLAEEIGDIFSAMEQGLLTEAEGVTAIQNAIPLLIEHFNELGEAGQLQVERILHAAQEFGLEIENLGELMQAYLTDEVLEEMGLVGERSIERIREAAQQLGVDFDILFQKIQDTFAPDTLEELMEKFGLTNEEARRLAEMLGVDVQTNLERMAASLGLSVDEFKALGAAVEKEFGIPMEEIEALLEAMGISAAELADALGVEVADGAGSIQDEQEAANERIAEGEARARALAEQLERAARASHDIGIPGGADIPGMAEGGIADRPMVREIGEAGPEVVAPVKALFGELGANIAQQVATAVGEGGGGGGTTYDFRGAAVFDHEGLMRMIGEGTRDNVGDSAVLIKEGQERVT